MNLKLKEMKYEELLKLSKEIKQQLYETMEKEVIEKKQREIYFTENGTYICHKCGGTHTCKAGFNKQRKQRYKCHDCNKIMIAQQATITFSSKKKLSQWICFTQSMLDGDSLYVSAEKANISKRTAFRWRHKLLYILQYLLNQEVLEDITYLDETLFSLVDKNPKAKHVKEEKKRGMSNQKINVTCAIDSKSNTIIKVVDRGRVTSKSLIEVYEGKIKKGSKVVSDSLRSYHKLMQQLEIDWKKIPSKKKSIEEYTLEPINKLHSQIDDFFFKYKGISVKYLQGYLALFDYQRKHSNHHRNKVFLSMIEDIFTGFGHLRCVDIDSGAPIYS